MLSRWNKDRGTSWYDLYSTRALYNLPLLYFVLRDDVLKVVSISRRNDQCLRAEKIRWNGMQNSLTKRLNHDEIEML